MAGVVVVVVVVGSSVVVVVDDDPVISRMPHTNTGSELLKAFFTVQC